jgi:WD40 repeat protein
LVKRLPAHRGIVFGLAFSPDGRLLTTGGNDQLIHFWETGTTNKLATLQGHDSEIWSLDFSKDGQRLISSGKDGTAKLWSVKPGPPKSQTFALPTNSTPMGPLPDGSALVTLDGKARITQLWSLPDVQLIRSFAWNEFEQQGYKDIQFFPANKSVVGVSTNGAVHLWDLATGAHLRSVQLGGTNFTPWQLSQDNRWLLGKLADNSGILCDLRSAQRVQHFPDFSRNYAAAFSPDGRWLAYSTTNYAIKIWNLADNREQAILKGHSWFVLSLRFSPDSRLLASGSSDADTCRLWSVESGKLFHPPLKGHQSGVFPIVFSSDGRTLITGSDDSTFRWWSISTGQEMLLFQNISMASGRDGFLFDTFSTQVELNPGGKWLVWQERQGLIRVTTLPTLAEIDAIEKGKLTDH